MQHFCPRTHSLLRLSLGGREFIFPRCPKQLLAYCVRLGGLDLQPSLIDSVSIVDDLSASSTAAADPLTGVEKGVALIAGLELDVDAELVLVGRGGVGNGGVSELLEDFLRAGAPAE